jgi:hypothetical protein
MTNYAGSILKLTSPLALIEIKVFCEGRLCFPLVVERLRKLLPDWKNKRANKKCNEKWKWLL